MSESRKNIAAALVKAQRAFGPALKTSTNPHFRSKYAALDAVIEAVIDALNSNGIALMQPTHECKDGVIVETLFLHESGEEWRSGPLHVPASKQDPQGYGSALTYARRYSLMAACGIAPEDDDGNAASRNAPPAAQPKGFDLPAACSWIAASSNIEQAKTRARTATDRAETQAQKDAIRAAYSEYEQASMVGA